MNILLTYTIGSLPTFIAECPLSLESRRSNKIHSDLLNFSCTSPSASDVVRIEIEKIGILENSVIEEPADTAFID